MDKTMNIANVNWKTWDNILKFKAEYNEKRDIFIVYSEEERDAISIDCKGEFWVRIDPQNGEILGLEIEDFKRVFLKKHPEIKTGKTSYIRPLADFVQIANCPA
jgi:hypothetical protein